MFLILGVISYGLLTANSFMKDQRNLRDAAITANAEKVSAQARAQTLVNANVQLEAIVETERRFRAETEEALNELNDIFTETRREQSQQTQALERYRLSPLATSEEQDRIERLSNLAMAARFREVENIFN